MSVKNESNNPTYTNRVVKGSDGVYRWKYTLSREQSLVYYRMMIKISAVIATIVCALLIFMLAIDSNFRFSIDVLLIVLAVYGLIVGLPGLIGYLSLKDDTRSYEMDEKCIRHKHAAKGGGDAVVYFNKVKWASEEGNAIRMKEGITTYTMFAPYEDAEFVKNFIFTRIEVR